MKSLHFGSAVIDIITLVASENIERATFSNDEKSFLMLEAGRKLPAQSISSNVGGGACNTAVSLARRGWQAAVRAKVGDDLNAAAIREHMSANDLVDRMIDSDLATGTAVMVASHDRNASIFVHRGANEALVPDDIGDLDGHDLVYIAPMSSGSADCFPLVAERAKQAGAMVASNPGIRQLLNKTEAFLGALQHLDLVSINRVEADALVPSLAFGGAASGTPADGPPLLRRGLLFGTVRIGLKPFMQMLQAKGPKWVLLTDGMDGAYLMTPGGEVIWHPALPAEVAGTAGAGDAFCSTTTAALAEGLAPEDALAQASANAASVVSFVDTTAGLLGAADLANRLAAVPTSLAETL
ncbi:MAG: carbohydrate kinase family protein [Pseudomonadota bacterium]